MPAREPIVEYVSVDDSQLCVFRWGEPQHPPILMIHATGFHARCWDAVIQQLGPGYCVYAVDLRGHGRSDNTPPYLWDRFAADVTAVCDHFDIRQAIGVGHSLGGHCVARVAALRPELFSALVLVDPVIFPPQLYQQSRFAELGDVADHPVARRRARFSDWREMHDRYHDRHPYRLWQPAIFEDYCRYGVLPSNDGEGVVLACPPQVEASIYINNFSSDVYPLLSRITVPVTILRAPPRDPNSQEMDFSASPTWPDLVHEFVNATDVLLPDLTHFIPMQAPELVVNHIQLACQNVTEAKQVGVDQ